MLNMYKNGRPGGRWKYNIEWGLYEIGCDGIECIDLPDSGFLCMWQETFAPQKAENFLTY